MHGLLEKQLVPIFRFSSINTAVGAPTTVLLTWHTDGCAGCATVFVCSRSCLGKKFPSQKKFLSFNTVHVDDTIGASTFRFTWHIDGWMSDGFQPCMPDDTVKFVVLKNIIHLSHTNAFPRAVHVKVRGWIALAGISCTPMLLMNSITGFYCVPSNGHKHNENYAVPIDIQSWALLIVPFLIISDITADLDASTPILKMVTRAVSYSIHMSI